MTLPQDGRLGLVNTASGKALAADGHRIRQAWPDKGDPAQQWRLRPAHDGKHTVVVENAANGLVLTVTGGDNGAEVALEAVRGTRHQHWRLVPLRSGEHALVNLASGKYLDLWNGDAGHEARLAQFDFWHGPQQRWSLRPATCHRNTRALVTLFRDEPDFFPIWLRYYSRFFAPEDIYVLEHQPAPDRAPDDRFVHIPIHHDEFSSDWHRDIVQRHQHDLIDRYDVVLSTDVDEIVAPDPRFCDLGQYIDQFDQDFVNCTGYEVLHLNDRESAFDPDQRVLAQRSTWFANPLYSKPLLARVPMTWLGGFHERPDHATNHDPNLYLIHLHRMDYGICHRRHLLRTTHQTAQDDIDNYRGYQNRIVEPEQFHHWFYQDRVNGDPIHPEPVPEHWRTIV
ncbi:RICIN domain-containing protein [Actinokineospora iranica]|uniref:Ricin-type beta-trefoil lectin domain-like n=1 Tax=Actinokineospora iranica TaxID=1271860 RepID=A0A1G6KSI9_9PSEU|nr:RICIN domain-containing protein [Actinokineospora iranica]SDC34040.1 Ricin-type beta-trefoil lectin domain-like [Actinokineospora iranica]